MLSQQQQCPATPPHQKRKRPNTPTSQPTLLTTAFDNQNLPAQHAGNNSPRTLVAARFQDLELRSIQSDGGGTTSASNASSATTPETPNNLDLDMDREPGRLDKLEAPRKRLRFVDGVEEIPRPSPTGASGEELQNNDGLTPQHPQLATEEASPGTARADPSTFTFPPRSHSSPVTPEQGKEPNSSPSTTEGLHSTLPSLSFASDNNPNNDAKPSDSNSNQDTNTTTSAPALPPPALAKSPSRKRIKSPPPPQAIPQAQTPPPEAGENPLPTSSPTSAPDQTDPDDPNHDDGRGINGIGYRPTPEQSYARTQRRQRQIAEWRARQAKEARERRSEKRTWRRQHSGSSGGGSMSPGAMDGSGGGVGGLTKEKVVRFA